MQQNNSIATHKILRKVLIENKQSYNTPFIRNFTINDTIQSLHQFEALLSTSNGMGVTEQNIAVYTPDLIKLDANPLKPASIKNNWTQHRFLFLMEILTEGQAYDVITYLQGYTDYSDISMSGYIPDDLKYYINSVIEVLRVKNPAGGYSYVPRRAYNILGDNIKHVDLIDNSEAALTPATILARMSCGINTDKLIVSVGDLDTAPVTSSRFNLDNVKYLSKVVNSYTNSKLTTDLSFDQNDIITQAHTNVQEASLLGNPVLLSVSHITGENRPFVLSQRILDAIDPTLKFDSTNRITVHTADNAIQMNKLNNMSVPGADIINSNEIGDTFLAPTIHNLKATYLVQALSSLMAEKMITELTVLISNTVGMEPVVQPMFVGMFVKGLDQATYFSQVVAEIKTRILPVLFDNNQLLVNAFVNISLMQDSIVSINVNDINNEPTLFRFPTFADSRFSSLIGTNQKQAELSDQFSNLFATVDSTIAGTESASNTEIMF